MVEKHSPEPWEHGEGLEVLSAGGVKVFSRLPGRERVNPYDVMEANIERVLACVNACAGIPTEILTGLAECSTQRRLQYLAEVAEKASRGVYDREGL